MDEQELSKRKYGIPEQKKFPMPDAAHVRSAIKFFNYVEPRYEQQLASAILKRMKEYGLTFQDISVGDENRFQKYVPKNELAHHGILGQKWGVRRYQNPDGMLTRAGKRRYSRQLNKLSDSIIAKHHKQVMLFNSYPYEDEKTRAINNAIYKETVDSLVSDLKEYKKVEDFVKSYGKMPTTELEKGYSFIKEMYADSPYIKK